MRRYRVGMARKVAWAAAGFFVAGVVGAVIHLGVMAALVACAFFLGIASTVVKNPSTLWVGPLQIDRQGLTTPDGKLLATRDEVESGVVTSSGLGALAELTTKDGRELHVGTRTWAEADAVLAELGLDVAGKRAKLDTASDVRIAVMFLLAQYVVPVGIAVVIGSVAIGGTFTGALMSVFGLIAVGALAALSRPPTVEIGGDAVIVQWRYKREVVPLRDIVDVRWTNSVIWLTRANGGRVKVGGLGMSAQAVRAAGTRIQQALQALHAARAPQVALDALTRRGRDIPSWRRDLDAVVGHAAGYRTTTIDAESVAVAMESPEARPTQRAGAAMILARHPDPEMRARVRIAVDRAVSPKLRIALDRVVENADDATLDAALSEAEAEFTAQSPARQTTA